MNKDFTQSIRSFLSRPSIFGCFFTITLLLVFSFASNSLLGLGQAWQADEYSHGPLIPLIALLIGWHRLTERQPDIKPTWLGAVVLLFGIALIAISRLSAFEPPAHYGFIVALMGLTLAFLGKNVTTALFPAFVYLFFAIPLPRLIYVTLSAEMQLWASTLGVSVLNLMNIPVFQEGNIIDLGAYKLQVVEACSGLRYLFPLMSFSFLIAFLLNDKMWKRVILFLSAIPITIGMNALRIAIVGATVNQWGLSVAEGFLHDFEGWVVFSLCVAILFAEMNLLRLVKKQKTNTSHFHYEYLGLAHGPLTKGSPALGLPALATFLISGIAALVLGTGLLDNRQEIVPTRPSFSSFPTQFSGWRGKSETLDPQIFSTLKLDDYWLADYKQETDNRSINLYMAYYASQRLGASIHSPANCLPGGGWKIEKRSLVGVPSGKETLPVTRLLIREGEKVMLVYYWFDGRNRILNEQYEAKWYLFIDSIVKHRTDGALVRLTTMLSPQEPETEADQRLQTFLSVAFPSIRQYIP